MKEVERLRREMEADEEELGLAEDGEEDDVDEPPPSATTAEVESPSPRVIPLDPPLAGDIDEDTTAAELEETEQPQSKNKKSKRKSNTPLAPELPTKTEKKSKARPIIASPEREDSPDVDDVPSGTTSDTPQTELSKREKRRLREAKKARSNSTSQVSVHYYKSCVFPSDMSRYAMCAKNNSRARQSYLRISMIQGTRWLLRQSKITSLIARRRGGKGNGEHWRVVRCRIANALVKSTESSRDTNHTHSTHGINP